MRHEKKFLALLLALVMTFALTACGGTLPATTLTASSERAESTERADDAVIQSNARSIRSAGMVQVLTEDIPGGEGGWLVTGSVDPDTYEVSILSIDPAEAGASDVIPDTPYGTYQVVVDPG